MRHRHREHRRRLGRRGIRRHRRRDGRPDRHGHRAERQDGPHAAASHRETGEEACCRGWDGDRLHRPGDGDRPDRVRDVRRRRRDGRRRDADPPDPDPGEVRPGDEAQERAPTRTGCCRHAVHAGRDADPDEVRTASGPEQRKPPEPAQPRRVPAEFRASEPVPPESARGPDGVREPPDAATEPTVRVLLLRVPRAPASVHRAWDRGHPASRDSASQPRAWGTPWGRRLRRNRRRRIHAVDEPRGLPLSTMRI